MTLVTSVDTATFVVPAVSFTPAPIQPATLRVLHVINGEHFSGAERVQQLLGKQLGRLGVEAHFASIKPGKFSALCGLDSAQVSDIPMRGRMDFSVIKRLELLIRQRGFELLHAHTPRSALITSLLSLRTGLPWVYHVHSPAARDSTRGLLNRANGLIERFCIHNCQRLITVSRSLRREMLRCGVNRQRVWVVPNGVPAIEPIQPGERLAQTTWRFGLVALMRPRKGVEIALQAMKLLQDQRRPVSLELIGGFETGGYQQQILGMIRQLGLQASVHCSGFTNDIPATLRRLDALILPSLFGEGMPMVVLEALAAAVPVIATRVEGTPEVVRDGVEGLLAEPGNATDLANKIKQLTSDRIRWSLMSHRAMQRHRSDYSDERMAERVAQLYRPLQANYTAH
jgi:glycosyltransferase involved in cell wall biosynthesis